MRSRGSDTLARLSSGADMSKDTVKAGYTIHQGPAIRGTLANVFTAQLVTAFDALSLARN